MTTEQFANEAHARNAAYEDGDLEKIEQHNNNIDAMIDSARPAERYSTEESVQDRNNDGSSQLSEETRS